jgi:hypothetical protein
VFEFVDHEDPICHVVAFKKISLKHPESRMNCFVTSFPFAGHSAIDDKGVQIMPAIQTEAQN